MSIPGKSDSELQAFVAALQALSAQHGIAIDGCGCCGSPYLYPCTDSVRYSLKGTDLKTDYHPTSEDAVMESESSAIAQKAAQPKPLFLSLSPQQARALVRVLATATDEDQDSIDAIHCMAAELLGDEEAAESELPICRAYANDGSN